MARVDFAFGAPNRLQTACEVVYRHYQAGHPLVVYSSNTDQLARFDNLLWSFQPEVFIPHCLSDDPALPECRVALTDQSPIAAVWANVPPDTVWLLNLDDECPETAEQFQRILEIVSTDGPDVQPARQKWVQYKEKGHALHAHDISAR